MLPPHIEQEIVRLHYVERWPPGTIARQLEVHHSAVRRVLFGSDPQAQPRRRPSIVEPYLSFIEETLRRYPSLPASRLYHMVRERGYPGREGHFRSLVAQLRPRRPSEAYLRLRTLPAEEGQVDWAHFGHLSVGRARRPLLAFLLVLSFSRALFLRFFLAQGFSEFVRGHREAFEHFQGLPRVLLYDNLRSAVLERQGQAIRFNSHFLDFARHYRFEPRPVAVGRGNEKGRVERIVRFVRTGFYPARRFRDLEDLNRQALEWSRGQALDRPWPEDRRVSVREAFQREREKLLPLPADPFPTDERVEVTVGKTPYIRFDLNDYSVPHDLGERTLTVVASPDSVRILAEDHVVATHSRSYDRDQQLEQPEHIAALVAEKREARVGRSLDRLSRSVPQSAQVLEILAARGHVLGRASSELLELLDAYGAEALTRAIAEALAADAPHPQAIRHVLERERKEARKPPARPLILPDDPRVRDLSVRAHELHTYDQLTSEEHSHGDEDRKQRS